MLAETMEDLSTILDDLSRVFERMSQTTDGVVNFWRLRPPESAALEGQGGPMTWWKSRGPAGCEKHGTGRCGDTCENWEAYDQQWTSFSWYDDDLMLKAM